MAIPVLSVSLVFTFALAGCGGARQASGAASRSIAEPKPTTPADPPPTGQLPRTVVPTRYTLSLRVVPSEEQLQGRVRIRVESERSVRRIWLHGKDLQVEAATVTPSDGQPIQAEWEQVTEDGVAALSLPQPLRAGTAAIEIRYHAPIREDLSGLYRVETAKKAYAFTQFESIAARSAFPCFDEPSFKAPFDVILEVKAEHEALANTPAVRKESLENGFKRIRYATTKPLPTYLLAWAIGPLDVVEGPTLPPNDVRDEPIPLRGVAVEGKGEQLAYALEHTLPLLAELERYFGIAYPFRKLDVVAVPDFAAGAMENVGLVTFREWLLLLDSEQAGERQRRAFAYVMAHELAHQWFGNLVTMPWWNDLWLNEAFATWMGHRVVAQVHPEYGAWIGLLASVQRAMKEDSLRHARAVRQPIESNHDIRNAFDAITYEKGAGVLAMFERYLGEEEFRRGIREYLRAHRWDNATSQDLLNALAEAAEEPRVRSAFTTFLEQPGLPSVKTTLDCSGKTPTVTLSQRRYLPVGSEASRDMHWQIPVCLRYQAQGKPQRQCTLLTQQQQTLPLKTAICPHWVMPNADGAGYYRWFLPSDALSALMEKGYASLSARERLATADALHAALDSAALKASEVFPYLDRLATDTRRRVAVAPMDVLEFARDYLATEAWRDQVEAYARALYTPVLQRLGWEAQAEDDGETKLLRASVIGFLADVGRDASVRERAAKLGRELLGIGAEGELKRDAVPPDLLGTVLAMAVQEGGEPVFDAVLEHFEQAEDADLRYRLLAALSSVRDPELSDRALQLVLSPKLRRNEVLVPLVRQMRDARTRARAWRWLKAHFDALSERVPRTRAGRLASLPSVFCSKERARDAQAFFEPKAQKLLGGPRNLAAALEEIHLCAARVDAQRESTRAFLQARDVDMESAGR